jgi:hypothetical protein
MMPRTYTNPRTGTRVEVWKARDWAPDRPKYLARTGFDPGTLDFPPESVERYEVKVDLGDWVAEGSLDDRPSIE